MLQVTQQYPVFSQANINDFPVDSRLYFLNLYGKAMADAFSTSEFGPTILWLEVAALASAIIGVRYLVRKGINLA